METSEVGYQVLCALFLKKGQAKDTRHLTVKFVLCSLIIKVLPASVLSITKFCAERPTKSLQDLERWVSSLNRYKRTGNV